MAKLTRSSNIVDPDVLFPCLDGFRHPTKLPITSDVIGVMRGLMRDKGLAVSQAVEKVSKMIYEKYKHDTVYCVHLNVIKKRVLRDYEIFKMARKRVLEGRTNSSECEKYVELAQRCNHLYEVTGITPYRRVQCEKEFGMKMSEWEHNYLVDQRGERRMECLKKDVDPVWLQSNERKEREKSRQSAWSKEKSCQFESTSSDAVDIPEVYMVQDVDDESGEETISKNTGNQGSTDEGSSSKKKRKSFVGKEDESDDPIPAEWRHIRISERVVRDDIYECLADLQGYGLSAREAQRAVVRCGKLFGRKWKILEEDEESFDLDTLPHEKNLRTACRQIEAKGLSLMVDKIVESSNDGRMITHATDSTTKKRVGQFAVGGIHIGRNTPFALPLIPVCGETTNDIAEQAKLMFEILAAVKGTTAKKLYSELIDVHMTDSTEHNKGFAAILAEMLDLDDIKGQLFCGAHTTLGFSAAMNSRLAVIERHMTLEAIFNNFMVDLDFDSKHGSVAGQACDVILRLVAPEYNHKAWNYNKDYLSFLRKHLLDQVLFSYKDHRFGCLSRAAAVIVYLKPWLKQWLDENPGVTNRLACIVRDFLVVDYLDIAFTCFAAFGLQLIEPFFSMTIADGATHSSLKIFYTDLHTRMGDEVTADFFCFDSPWFSSVSKSIFAGVKESYNSKVVSAVQELAESYTEECIRLANFFMPELRTVLGRQRRDYGISDDFEPQFPVEQQAENVDDTPGHNLASERICGKVDYRLQKLTQLEAVSRSIILESTSQLREESSVSFREFKRKAEEIQELKLSWSSKMKAKFEEKLSEKQAIAATKDAKRLDLLDNLKQVGGPFTSAEEVEEFIAESNDSIEREKNEKKKVKMMSDVKKRMKNELVFARDSSTSLPRSDPIFRIQVTLPNKKRRDKTASEFATSLKTLLGKKSERTTVTLDVFKKSLEEVVNVA